MTKLACVTHRCMSHTVLISMFLLKWCAFLHACVTTFFKQCFVSTCTFFELLFKRVQYNKVNLGFRVTCSRFIPPPPQSAFYCMTNSHDALLLTLHSSLHHACALKSSIYYWRWRLLRCCKGLLAQGQTKTIQSPLLPHPASSEEEVTFPSYSFVLFKCAIPSQNVTWMIFKGLFHYVNLYLSTTRQLFPSFWN